MMKKMISCLLALMMLLTASSAFGASLEELEFDNHLMEFLGKTDWETQDIAMQFQLESNTADVVIRPTGEKLHIVTRNNGVEESHIQLEPSGLYIGAKGAGILLRTSTLFTVEQDIIKAVEAFLTEIEKSIPADQVPDEAELSKYIAQLSEQAAAAQTQEQADAATVSAAAVAFADNFRADDILEVKEEAGSVEITLRADAFAASLGAALDELFANPDIEALMERRTTRTGKKSYAELKADWEKNREAALEIVRNIQSSDKIDENGHWTSTFQISEDAESGKALVCNADTWIDTELDVFVTNIQLGQKDEEAKLVYELAVSPYYYGEKMTLGDSYTELTLTGFEKDKFGGKGKLATVINGKEELSAEFSPEALYVWGPTGGFSITARETWTGKTRYEMHVANAEGETSGLVVDFYEEEDSMICEMRNSETAPAAQIKFGRIDKINIDDLSGMANLTEITAEMIEQELMNIMQSLLPAPAAAEAEAGK